MYDFGLRKVQHNMSGEVLFVNLPHGWCRNNDVRKGTKISLQMDEHKRLIISPIEEIENEVQ